MGAKRLQGIKQGEENRIKSAHKILVQCISKVIKKVKLPANYIYLPYGPT